MIKIMTERFEQITRLADLITAELTGEIDDADLKELERWKAASTENLALYEEYRSRAFLERKIRFIGQNHWEEAYQNFEDKTRSIKRRKRSLIFYRYAGIIAVLIILGGSFYLFKNKRNEDASPVVTQKIHPGGMKAILTCPDGTTVDISDTTYLAFVETGKVNTFSTEEKVTTKEKREHFHTITIPRGGEYALTLSDGSRLRMNSESELRIPAHFNESSRDVYMTGEIYFDVAHNATIPFVVHTNQGVIKVVGTSFNVRNYADEIFMAATLVSGKVAFEAEGKDTYLSPGEQLKLNKNSGETSVEEVNVGLFCSWKDGRFAFEKQRLEEIMNTISRWYNINVFYENQSMKDILFTGNIRRYEDLDQVVEMLRLINKIDIEINGNSVFVKK